MGRWGEIHVGAGLADNFCQSQTIFGQKPPLQLKTQNFLKLVHFGSYICAVAD